MMSSGVSAALCIIGVAWLGGIGGRPNGLIGGGAPVFASPGVEITMPGRLVCARAAPASAPMAITTAPSATAAGTRTGMAGLGSVRRAVRMGSLVGARGGGSGAPRVGLHSRQRSATRPARNEVFHTKRGSGKAES